MSDPTYADLTYADFYRSLDGMTALSVAAATPLRRLPDERDTAFVKRIVATYMAVAAQSGVHVSPLPVASDQCGGGA